VMVRDEAPVAGLRAERCHPISNLSGRRFAPLSVSIRHRASIERIHRPGTDRRVDALMQKFRSVCGQ
jgi:hypothetical protein